MSPAVMIVGLIAWGWLLYLFFAPRPKAEERRPGPLPPEVTRSFREPYEFGHPCRLSDEALDRWPVLDEEPRQ